jgi:hypothetical protein
MDWKRVKTFSQVLVVFPCVHTNFGIHTKFNVKSKICFFISGCDVRG